jgi:hypothetical protein
MITRSKAEPSRYRHAIAVRSGTPALVIRTVRTEIDPKLSADATISSVARPIEVLEDSIGAM